MHYVAYLDSPNRRVEVDGDTFIQAQHNAAVLLETRRERDIYLIACPEVKVTTEQLIADTEEDSCHSPSQSA
jgi:hypothetical protein